MSETSEARPLAPGVVEKGMYEAYGSVTDHKNYQGLPIPNWEDLPVKIQEAWAAAAKYAFGVFLDVTFKHMPDPANADPTLTIFHEPREDGE